MNESESVKKGEIEKLEREINNCRRCDLWKIRNNPVIGEGPANSSIIFIGEAPGYNEDLQGKPFVGRAGKVLDELLESVGLKREEIYISNILKCRPPNNRNPALEEVKACAPYLDTQIAIIQPKIIIPLGNFALSYIFEKFHLEQKKIGEVHGKVFNIRDLAGIKKIIPLYHPAVATYNFQMKEVLFNDFKVLKKLQLIL